jgi:hypothetical protein
MQRTPSDSSLDGDDSTVSSKSNRNTSNDRPINGAGSRGNAQQVADFSDMPSLATYRGDEISIASTLWTDCDQSLPSLSSYRTKDLSVSGSHHSKNKNKSSSGVSESDEEDELDTGDIGKEKKTTGMLPGKSSKIDSPPGTQSGVRQPAKSMDNPESSLQHEAPGSATALRGGDSLPRLPRRIAMEDSRHSSTQQSKVSEIEDSESESDISDNSNNSPDVSIDTDEEHDDDVIEPTREPIHVTPAASAIEHFSPQSQKSASKVNGIVPSPPSLTEDTKEKSEKSHSKVKTKKSPSRTRAHVEPPALISTPPKGQHSIRKSPKSSPRIADQSPSKAPSKSLTPHLEEGQRFGSRKKKDSKSGKSKKHGEKERRTPSRSTSESGTRLHEPKRKHGDKRLRGLTRANSEKVPILDSRVPAEDKKRGIFKRFSSSLKQMVRPARTKSGTFGNSRSTLLREKEKMKVKKIGEKG